jgi:2-keto-4-pentenoate hydratase/2-oxohepta-3-ene-1,7-dioic acid hydratase in catechol pathway
MSLIAGFVVANDVTEREWQFERGGQWSKAKSADTFAPVGPWVVTPDELSDGLDLRIWLEKNNVSRASSH